MNKREGLVAGKTVTSPIFVCVEISEAERQSVLPGQLLTLEMCGVNIIGENFKCVLGRLTETEGI